MHKTATISINYHKICASLLKGLPERTTDVIVRRFGLKSGHPETLESIGETYGITRERVRQIEREGMAKIKSRAGEHSEVFALFNKTIDLFGGLKKESDLVSVLGKENNYSRILFLLNLADKLKRYSEEKEYHTFWAKDENILDVLKKITGAVVAYFEKEKKPVSQDEFFKGCADAISKIAGKKIDKKSAESYLEILRKIQKNSEGLFGLSDWVEINPKGIKDKAYLVFKKMGKSLHFREVAEAIENYFGANKKKAHPATVHNELIKDPRFVLIGRGLYALKEWGYEPGIVREVIIKVMKDSNKPLTKEEISLAVLKQRVVKENTVFLNLQNKNYFIKDSQGNYTPRSSA